MASFAPPFAFEVYTLSRPVIVVHIFLTALRILAGIQFAPWIRILALASAIPANFFLTLYTEDRRERARARMRGAELPPLVSYKWPGGLDLLAEMRKMEKRKAYISERIATWMDDLGQTIQIYTMFERRIATTEPAYIKANILLNLLSSFSAVLSTEFTNFEKGKLAGSQLASILGDGVFNSDGDLWKFHRSMTRPFFSRDRISHFDIFNRHVDVALEHMKTRLREGYALDMQDLVSRFTLDSATEFLFGKDVQSLSAGLPYPSIGCVSASANWLNPQHPANRFPKAFSQAQVQGAMRLRLGSLWRWFELSGDKTKEHMRIIDAFVEPILSDAIRKNKATSNPASAGNGDEDSETLLDHLVKFVVEHKALKDEIVNIMIAGRDTTAATLTFVVYMLSQHPDVAERLYEEIQTKLPNSRCPTFDD
ncbi:cytochrome P450, partial [Amylostereum chailletii]